MSALDTAAAWADATRQLVQYARAPDFEDGVHGGPPTTSAALPTPSSATSRISEVGKSMIDRSMR